MRLEGLPEYQVRHGTHRLKVQLLPKGAAKLLNSGAQSNETMSTVLWTRGPDNTSAVYGRKRFGRV